RHSTALLVDRLSRANSRALRRPIRRTTGDTRGVVARRELESKSLRGSRRAHSVTSQPVFHQIPIPCVGMTRGNQRIGSVRRCRAFLTSNFTKSLSLLSPRLFPEA